ncbi:MAG TPA: VOC family protein [Gaiellaceae bacterium]|nr:VOC family protein [Gaiellaceae bacterium]
MRMGAVHLTVADLDRSLAYYEEQIGLRVHERDGGRARLGAGGEDLLVLTEQPGARPADGYSGLFHFALLVPERADLARWLGHAARDRVPLAGLSDHDVSEAIYLRDPDHHGIEIYADRPRELWEGHVRERMTTLPLDTDDLLRLDDGAYAGLPEGTTMGHVHLCVSGVEAAVEFYRGLGLELMAQLGDQAAFLSYGGYHHHVGVNTWQSRGAPYAPDDRARLTRMTIHGAPEERDVRDPSGNPVRLVTAA